MGVWQALTPHKAAKVLFSKLDDKPKLGEMPRWSFNEMNAVLGDKKKRTYGLDTR